jgi:hypothetical protein
MAPRQAWSVAWSSVNVERGSIDELTMRELNCRSTFWKHRLPYRGRVVRRNEERGLTFSAVVPVAVFVMESDMWECPDDVEIEENGIMLLLTESDRHQRRGG